MVDDEKGGGEGRRVEVDSDGNETGAGVITERRCRYDGRGLSFWVGLSLGLPSGGII